MNSTIHQNRNEACDRPNKDWNRDKTVTIRKLDNIYGIIDIENELTKPKTKTQDYKI